MAHSPEDRLLHQILAAPESAAGNGAPALDHISEERLALFAEGGLTDEDQTRVTSHLADCPQCRRIVATVWLADQDDSTPQPMTSSEAAIGLSATPDRRVVRRKWVALAVACSVAGVSLLVWTVNPRRDATAEQKTYRQVEQLIAAADFAQATRVLDTARNQGVWSDRLLSLNLQTVRRIPDRLALATAGTLADFGYDYDGTLARGPSRNSGLHEAAELLPPTQTESWELLLNRGHVRLTAGDLELAAADFRQAATLAPLEPLSWLGVGLAAFLQNDLPAAEHAFRKCLELHPDHRAALINLAMTLDELGRADESRTVWRTVLHQPLPEAERTRIERHVQSLEESP